MGRRIVFFGNERLATGVTTTAPTLGALVDAGYEVVALVASHEPGVSRGRRELEVKVVAEKYGVPVLLPDNPRDIADTLREFKADIGVLVAYGRIVPQSVIDIFPGGIVNLHPSLLPLHRGPIPIESVILDGSAKTGISIMRLVKAMDAGPVYGQSEIELHGDETKQELANKLLEIGGSMLIELLPGILGGSVVALPQDDSRATYDKLLAKDNGLIDWTKPAISLEREIRAYAGWPKSYTKLGSVDVVITKARVDFSQSAHAQPGDVSLAKETAEIVVCTGDGSLHIERLIPAGKAEMDVPSFLNGYQHRF